MYSYEDRLRAVKLYIQYEKSYASVYRELGYPPSSHSIKLWYKEYEQNADLHKSYNKTNKYSEELIIPGPFEPPVRTLRATIPESEGHIFR